jgi:DNA-binding LytR/AlgR family response regulator
MIVKIGKTFFFLNPDEIDCVESERNYIRIHRGDRSYLMKKTLRDIWDDLDSDRFIRVNRSMIVNIDRIKEMHEAENYTFRVVLDTGKSWTIRRRSKENLFKALKLPQ